MHLNILYTVTSINVLDITVGDIIVIDWEGKKIPSDLRVGKVISIDEGFPKIENQFGNDSQPSNRFPNVKYYLVNGLNK